MMVIGPPTLCRSACGRGLEILMVFTNTTEDVPARHVLNFSSNDTEDVLAEFSFHQATINDVIYFFKKIHILRFIT